MNARLIRATLFDLNNVGEDYVHYMRNFDSVRCSVFQSACALFGLQFSRRKFNHLVKDYLSIGGDIAFHHHPSFWQHLFETLTGRKLSYPEIERLYAAYLEIYEEKITAYPDFLQAVREGRSRGLKTGVVANGNTERVYRFLEKFGLRDMFDTIVTSGGTPFAKPEQEIFDLALLNLGRPAPLETVFIGDRLDNDVAGANRIGVWSVRLLRSGTDAVRPKNTLEEPDFTIQNLEQLFLLRLFDYENPVTSAVIACGGRGSRMGPITENTQKCMIEIGGKPVLALLVDRLLSMGIRTIHFLLGYRADDVVNFFGRRQQHFNANFHHTNAGSTGAAILKVVEDLPASFVYSHGNIVVGRDLLSGLLKQHYKTGGLSSFAVTQRSIAKTHPVFLLGNEARNNRAVGVRRHPTDSQRAKKSFSYSIGLGIITKSDLAKDCISGEVTVEQLLDGALDRVSLFRYNNDWVHLEKPTDIARLNAMGGSVLYDGQGAAHDS